MTDCLLESKLRSIPKIAEGKVRDIYQIDDQHLLMVTTDRLSAFDVILPNGIPGKGRLLNQISQFWFTHTQHIIANHCVDMPLEDFLSNDEIQHLDGRGLVVRKLDALPIEAVVRGYIIGSGWQDYLDNGSVCGIQLPENLKLAEKLATPIFTPATKAAVGDHDENISMQKANELVGEKLAEQVKDVAIQLYEFAAQLAKTKNLIIADTKFEFGLDANQKLVLIDEALTPDSSRFWSAQSYQVGENPASFDKQFVRDYLNSLDWDKTAPGPTLPDNVINETAQKYQEAVDLITAIQL